MFFNISPKIFKFCFTSIFLENKKKVNKTIFLILFHLKLDVNFYNKKHFDFSETKVITIIQYL